MDSQTEAPTIDEAREAYTGYKVIRDQYGDNFCVVKNEHGITLHGGSMYAPAPIARVPIRDDENAAYMLADCIASTAYDRGF